MAKRIMSKTQRNDLLEHAITVLWDKMKTIGRQDQKTVRPGVIVVVKWLDAMPTTEMVLSIDSANGKFDPNASMELYNIATKSTHHLACCEQIIHVIGKLS